MAQGSSIDGVAASAGREDATVRIRAMLPTLHGGVLAVAEHVLADPSATQLSVAELAKQVGTSGATVTRFARAVGFDNFQDLRLRIAREAGRSDANQWEDAFQPDRPVGDSTEAIAAAIAKQNIQAIERTVRQLDLSAVEAASTAMARAGRVDIYGVGGSITPANELELVLSYSGRNARAWSDVHGAVVSAAKLTARDVAVGISHSGTTRETWEPLNMAKERGATIVVITNHPHSPIGRLADVMLTTTVEESAFHPAPFAVRHSQLVVIDCLQVRIVQQNHEEFVDLRRRVSHVAADHEISPQRRKRAPSAKGHSGNA